MGATAILTAPKTQTTKTKNTSSLEEFFSMSIDRMSEKELDAFEKTSEEIMAANSKR